MNPLAAIQGILTAGGGIIRSIFGDKSAREAGQHAENMAGKDQFAAEFQVSNRTRYDSLIDGFNRLPRPVIVAMVIYYFWLAQDDPIEFQKLNLGLDTIPEHMWMIAGAVISFYFVAREMSKGRDKKLALSKAEFNERLRQTKELDMLKVERDGYLPEKEYRAEMASEEPLSNPAILEWNRRRQGKAPAD